MSQFLVKPESLKQSGNSLTSSSEKIRSYAAQITSIKDDLDGELSMVRASLESIITDTYTRADKMSALGQGIITIAGLYEAAENSVLSNQSTTGTFTETPGGSKNGTTDVFDGTGMYGGDQRHFKNVDDAFCDWIRQQHPEYANVPNDQIKELLAKFSAVGCNWTAAANIIFAEFYGREDEFKKKFGFDMYENGELNYDKLIADIFLFTQGQFYVGKGDTMGKEALSDSMNNYYRHNPSEFEAKYGFNPLDKNGKLTSAAMKKINAERDKLIKDAKANDGVVHWANDEYGLGTDEFPNRINHYLRDKGINNFKYDSATTYSNNTIEKALNKGKDVIICAKNFSLYDPATGAEVHSGVDAHAMVVTGITADGNYIVSSWGQEFIYKPGSTTYHTAIMDINKG